ncbi:hypothetical protein [Acanthopleuribacter pedis]|uniref:Uncharacterized protein n=1 Tax=Acanthopleuribacter pedis TaxID=442870 RepID=A0A8J7QAN1_9BACT|nr:hypothetical protein [Acanthopleuribacter pedis]MBO1321946.1 hypothetical protein [Acanthopleuribacter pedis]
MHLFTFCVIVSYCPTIEFVPPYPESTATTWEDALVELQETIIYELLHPFKTPDKSKFPALSLFVAQTPAADLRRFIDHPEGKVRHYALYAAMIRGLKDVDQLLLDALNDDAPLKIALLPARQMPLNQVVTRWILMRLIGTQLNTISVDHPGRLSAPRVNLIYQTALSDENHPLFEPLLTEVPAPRRFAPMIRNLAEEGSQAALIALARFREADDADLIAAYVCGVQENTGALEAAALFPHKRLRPSLEDVLLRSAAQTEEPGEQTALFQALLGQEADWCEATLVPFFGSLDPNNASHTKILWNFWHVVSQREDWVNRHQYLVRQIAMRHHIMDFGTFSLLAKKDPAFGLQLCQTLLLESERPIYPQKWTPLLLGRWLKAMGEAGHDVPSLEIIPTEAPVFVHPHIKESWYRR